MTERVMRVDRRITNEASVSELVDSSLQPGGSISLTFSDGIVSVTFDQSGDWTITAGLSVVSDRLSRLTRAFQDLGFFQATEHGGMIYHLWTTALEESQDSRDNAEKVLLQVLKCFQQPFANNYIS